MSRGRFRGALCEYFSPAHPGAQTETGGLQFKERRFIPQFNLIYSPDPYIARLISSFVPRRRRKKAHARVRICARLLKVASISSV